MSEGVRLASRMRDIAPFHVMSILGEARRLESEGRDIVHMEIGEPDFPSPQPVIEAGHRALADGLTHYTPAAGLPALREAISTFYRQRFAVDVPAARIIVTPGASGALQLALGVLIEPGDEVLLPDPGYPCNRNLVSLLGAQSVALPLRGDNGFAPEVDAVRGALTPCTRALMVASPANPTGHVIDLNGLRALRDTLVAGGDAMLICDEIYQGLQYEGAAQTALALASDRIIVINSFSKYFGMTGWRVGWVVAPEALIEPMERLAQNLFLAAPTPSQYAALPAFSADTREILERRRALYQARRDYLVEALRGLGFGIAHAPAGAFYLYADVSGLSADSLSFTRALLAEAGVAATPGVDFGRHDPERYVRFAYTTDLDRLRTGVERIVDFLAASNAR